MRVIAGSAKGIPLITPSGQDTRPTVDRVKEAIFGGIQFEVKDSVVLDLFAGSGALGIEALSRGAKKCVFVDHSKQAVLAINKNLARTKFHGAEIIEKPFQIALKSIKDQFDFVFLDPPYQENLYNEAVKSLVEHGLIKKGGKIIIEHDGSAQIDIDAKAKKKKYGRTYISIYVI